MTESLVLTIIGKDRPGMVEQVAAVIADHDGSWVESSMSRLAGRFAGILRANVPAEQSDQLVAALKALANADLQLVVQRGEGPADNDELTRVRLELVGGDRPGIIRSVSEVLAARGVNVEELNTRCEDAPHSGDSLFRATALLQIPAGLKIDVLRADLERIAGDLMVDIDVRKPDANE